MLSDLHIQLAALADAPAIAALSKAEIERGLRHRWTPLRVRRAIKDTRTNVALVRKHGCLAGFGIMVYDEDTAHLYLLAVHPALRRRGIASALLVWLEKVALVAGITTVQVQAREQNTAALAFYGRHGYRQVSIEQGMYGEMENGVHLEKLLTHYRASED
ncbi:MAG: GNAT family N-acetyltransferase [Methylovulum sp.]|nr:GNAT family N-acetyltransferase [Methylovulum sp.]